MGNNLTVNELDDCEPIKANKDLTDKDGERESVSGKELNADAAAYPCGLVAKSVFTDKFTSFMDEAGKVYAIDDSDIAWESDVEYKFKNLAVPDWKDIQWADVEDCKFNPRN